MKTISTYNGELGVGKTSEFSDLYFEIAKDLVENGNRVDSRNGAVAEFLNFKTIVTNPKARCVGGYRRDINIFFLLAEAIWIWTGRRDVEFLTIFNKRMADFSDDGLSFHAPYGFRIRHHGQSSLEENKPGSKDSDQMLKALEMLGENPEDRRVVINIWNADLDLGTKSKDLPCNDTLMFKIRKNKLYQTVANRSNDIHWGLPTNVFQFSFIGEIMSRILGTELGDQVHNSQSLHAYFDNELTYKIYDNVLQGRGVEQIYDITKYSDMDFSFGGNFNIPNRVQQVDYTLSSIIERLSLCRKMIFPNDEEDYIRTLNMKSRYFALVYEILKVYVIYSQGHRLADDKLEAVQKLLILRRGYNGLCEDYLVLAMNFFVSRLNIEDKSFMASFFNANTTKYLGTL